jgi:membrane-associated protease RseP (regulator of RpoE activity)
MKTFSRTVAVGMAILGVLLVSDVARAAKPNTRLLPPPGLLPVVHAPSVGYSYALIPGHGYRVTGVLPGTPAASIGLEVGDVVLAINGHRLTHMGADLPARREAAANGGWATLRIRDVRTGWVASRTVNLLRPFGPVGPVGPIHPKPIGPIVIRPGIGSR